MNLSLLRSSGTAQYGFGEAVAFGRAIAMAVLRSEPLPGVDDFVEQTVLQYVSGAAR